MAWDWGFARAVVLLIGWPALVVAGFWMMRQARGFRDVVGERTASGLVTGTMVAWLSASALLGMTATALLYMSPSGAIVVMPVFVAWMGILGYMVRIAGRWRAEARMARRFYDDTERVDRLKASIINRFSHAFATPLTPMASEITLLRGEYKGPLTPGQRRCVDMLAKSQNRLARMVEQAVLAGQVHGGQIALALRKEDLGAIVRELAPSRLRGAERLPPLSAFVDRDRIKFVLERILEYVADQEEARVQGARDGQVRIEFLYRSAEDAASRFGLLEEAASDFQSSDPLDLGLFTARGLVELHGGQLECASDGKQARITVVLPVESVAQKSMPGIANPTAASTA